MSDVKRAKISYTYFFTPHRSGDSGRTNSWEELKRDIDSKFVHCWFSDDPADVEERAELKAIDTARNFLHGSGLPFPVQRAFIDDFSLSHQFLNITDDSVMISCFESADVMSFSLNLCVEDVSCSDLVYMRQIFCDNPVFLFNKDHSRVKTDGFASDMAGKNGSGSWAAVTEYSGIHDDEEIYVSVEKMFKATLRMLGIEPRDLNSSFLAELNDLKDYNNVYELEEKEKAFIYGLMSGDEGWTFVPEELVDKRLEVRWGSRDFVRFYNFDTGSVLLNLNCSERSGEYIKRQEHFGGYYYGGINPYFLLDPPVAGVAHGIIFSLEVVLVIKAIANRIYAHQADYRRDADRNLNRTLKETKNYRRELIITLRKVEKISISEIGELENMLLRVQQIESIIDKLKYLLELLEGEIDLMYQESTNKLVNLLTIFGLILSAAGVAASIIGIL